jgi:hypothetical protein
MERRRMGGEAGEEGEVEDEEAEAADEDADEEESRSRPKRPPQLGSRDNFWGG